MTTMLQLLIIMHTHTYTCAYAVLYSYHLWHQYLCVGGSKLLLRIYEKLVASKLRKAGGGQLQV